MKHHTRPAHAGLLSVVALTAAACGGAGGGAGNMDHGGMASGMLMENGRYSDERFIDARVPHHRGPWRWRRSRSRTPSTKRKGNFRMT